MDPVAYQLFTDGSRRAVYDGGQRQWFIDDGGGRVYGVWFIPRGEPTRRSLLAVGRSTIPNHTKDTAAFLQTIRAQPG